MWLLVGQGFIANASVSAKNVSASTNVILSLVGILVSLSAFVMLYQSYQARGYLQFLGQQVKQGTLQAEHIPLTGWPKNRIKGWWRNYWVGPWIRQPRDLFEPWLLLPYLFISMWMIILLRVWSRMDTAVISILGMILPAAILSTSCIVLVRSQGKDDNSTEEQAQVSKAGGGRDPLE